MVLRMRGMVSPTGAAGVVRVALRAETLECVATLYYTHPTHAARAQAETAEVVTESSSIDVDPNFRKKKIAGLRARTEISLGCYFQRHQSPSASGDPLYFEKVQCPFFKYTFCPSIRERGRERREEPRIPYKQLVWAHVWGRDSSLSGDPRLKSSWEAGGGLALAAPRC